MSTTTHIVKHGDTLWSISKARYGDPQYWELIAQHNKLPNANRILAGQIINIPPKNLHNHNATIPHKSQALTSNFTPPDRGTKTDLWSLPTTQAPTGIAGDTLHWIDNEPVLCPRLYPTKHALEPAIDVEDPELSLKLDRDVQLFKMKAFFSIGSYNIEATLSISGEANLKKKGKSDIILSKDSVEKNNVKITKEGIEACFNFQNQNWKKEFNIKNYTPALTHKETGLKIEFKTLNNSMVTLQSPLYEVKIEEGGYIFEGKVEIKLELNITRNEFLEKLKKEAVRFAEKAYATVEWVRNAIVQIAPIGLGVLVGGVMIYGAVGLANISLKSMSLTGPAGAITFAGALAVVGLGYMLNRHEKYDLSTI